VVPAHSFRAAAASELPQSSVLIRIRNQSGAWGWQPTTKIIEEVADQWAFLARVLNICADDQQLERYHLYGYSGFDSERHTCQYECGIICGPNFCFVLKSLLVETKQGMALRAWQLVHPKKAKQMPLRIPTCGKTPPDQTAVNKPYN